MFKVDRYDEIVRIIMGTEVNGRIIFSVAAYVADGLLIDTGCHNTRRELAAYLERHNISAAANTHHHVDHIGGNKLIMDGLKVPVFAPSKSVPKIANKQKLFSYQKVLWGGPEPCEVKALREKVNTAHYSFQVVQTSGHSEDHVVFFLEEKGWLFTGDEFTVENPNSSRKGEDNKKILKALKRMLSLKPQLLISSSGKIYRDGSAVLKRTIAYYEAIRDAVCAMRKSGLTSEEIVSSLFGRETSLKEYTGGNFSRKNFVEGFSCLE